MMKQMLERAGHEVDEAPHGRAALRQLRVRPSELVVTNVHMPEMDGLELIKALQKEDPPLPVMAVSGGGGLTSNRERYTADILEIAKHFGAARVLAKPFEWSDLTEAVDALLAPA